MDRIRTFVINPIRSLVEDDQNATDVSLSKSNCRSSMEEHSTNNVKHKDATPQAHKKKFKEAAIIAKKGGPSVSIEHLKSARMSGVAIDLFLRVVKSIQTGFWNVDEALAQEIAYAHGEHMSKKNHTKQAGCLSELLKFADTKSSSHRVAVLILHADQVGALDDLSNLFNNGLIEPLVQGFFGKLLPQQDLKDQASLLRLEKEMRHAIQENDKPQENEHYIAGISPLSKARQLSPVPGLFDKMLSYVLDIPEDKIKNTIIDRSNALLIPKCMSRLYESGYIYFKKENETSYAYYLEHPGFVKLTTDVDLTGTDEDYLRIRALTCRLKSDISATRIWDKIIKEEMYFKRYNNQSDYGSLESRLNQSILVA